MFDDFLREWSERTGEPFHEFDRPTDYDDYVDGKPRLDGVRSFRAELTCRWGRRPIRPRRRPSMRSGHARTASCSSWTQQGVEPYEGSVRFAEAARDQGFRRAVVSSSTNCQDVLVAAGIDHLFEERVDGVVAERERLAGKPAPDTFLEGARRLGAQPDHAAVFEDAQAGVEAGRAGSFGWVVGVDRTGQAEALRRRGADVVVDDLAELLERK